VKFETLLRDFFLVAASFRSRKTSLRIGIGISYPLDVVYVFSSAMRQCLFCDNKANSREHAWPDWILEGLRTGRQKNMRGFIGEREVYWIGPKPELKLRVVCTKCNNGWMHDLEDENKPLLGSLMRDVASPIDPEQQWSVSRWVIKTAMVFESVATKATVPVFHPTTT
jgi:hypothetical protein